MSKSLNQASLRLQRILIRTFPYHFTEHYNPGLTNQLAELLVLVRQTERCHQAAQITLVPDYKTINTRIESLNQLRLATQEDDELVLLKHTITQGWPSTIKEVPNVIQLSTKNLL